MLNTFLKLIIRNFDLLINSFAPAWKAKNVRKVAMQKTVIINHN